MFGKVNLLRTAPIRSVINKKSIYQTLTSFLDDESKKLLEKDGRVNDLNTLQPKPDVPGLSSNVLSIPDYEVGPGASKTGVYKNAEYFCYHPMSFYNAEIELMSYRLPQPSALND